MSGDKPQPSSIRRQLVWTAIIATVLWMFWWLPPLAARQDAVFRAFAPLVAIKAHIQNRFVKDVSEEDLIDGAINGMVNRLDPFSQYLSPKKYPVFLEQASGYVGIGIQVDVNPVTHDLVITGPTDDSPAFEAGVRVGDVIVKIAGTAVNRLKPRESTENLRGLEGSMAHFTVERPPNRELIEFVVPRRRIATRTVLGLMRHDENWDYFVDSPRGIGYVRIREFWENTPRDFEDAMAAMIATGLTGLVIDVRFNPGGDMRACLEVVDRFVGSGTLLTTRTRLGVESAVEATSDDVLPNFPLAVLINGSSASGAEILAGALQDHRRARVFGQRSYGKGSVQTVIPLEDGRSALRLTTAHYYLPSGRCIHREEDMDATSPWGITPDVPLLLSVDEMTILHGEMSRMRVAITADNPPRDLAADVQLMTAVEWVARQGTAPTTARSSTSESDG